MLKIYDEITATILEQMKTVDKNWLEPFSGGCPAQNLVSGKCYQGINRLILGLKGNGIWASYKQWQEKGCQVKKGEKGTRIVFFKMMEKENKKGEKESFPLLRYSTVFRQSQVEGFESENRENNVQSLAYIDQYVKNTGAKIQHDTSGAYFAPEPDFINMPVMENFNGDTKRATSNYYGVLFHELTHWTGHKTRLDRLKLRGTKQEYAFEELIAELGAAFQCNAHGLDVEPREDHAKYLNSWIKCLEDDTKFIFKAAAAAEKATTYLNEMQEIKQAA